MTILDVNLDRLRYLSDVLEGKGRVTLLASNVTNIEDAVTNATLPYVLKLANLGYHEAVRQDGALRKGLSIFRDKLASQPVAESLGMDWVPYEICC